MVGANNAALGVEPASAERCASMGAGGREGVHFIAPLQDTYFFPRKRDFGQGIFLQGGKRYLFRFVPCEPQAALGFFLILDIQTMFLMCNVLFAVKIGEYIDGK